MLSPIPSLKLTWLACENRRASGKQAVITLLCFFLAWQTSPLGATENQTLAPFKAEYVVENDYVTGGKAFLSLAPKDNGLFDFVLQTKPSGIFKWTGKGNIREQAELPTLKAPFASTKYLHKDKGKPERSHEILFDRITSTYQHIKNKNTTEHELPENAVDRLSVTLLLLNALKNDPDFSTIEVQVVNGPTVESVTYHNNGTEKLATRLGEFSAHRISKVSGTRETLIWLAGAGAAETIIPVQIEHRKRGKLSLRLKVTEFSLLD